MRIFWIFLATVSLLVFTSCGDYSKLLKKGSLEEKLKAADRYYVKEDYAHALGLYENLLGYYNGQPEQEEISFRLAQCHYYQGSLDLASYLFRTFHETYPNSKHAEEAFFLVAYSHYQGALGPELDQTNTYRSLDELQLFINFYPESKRVGQANQAMDKLREVLTEKAYLSAKLFYEIEDYKAAIVALKNVLKDFPDIPQKEEIDWMIVHSHYLLAKNSAEFVYRDGILEPIRKNRFEQTIENALLFMESYPLSRYRADVESFKKKSETQLSLKP